MNDHRNCPECGSHNTTELSEPLENHGFWAIETELLGDWATNYESSIQIISKRDVTGRIIYIARVYDSPAYLLHVEKVKTLATAQDADHVEAASRAIEGAKKNVRKGVK